MGWGGVAALCEEAGRQLSGCGAAGADSVDGRCVKSGASRGTDFVQLFYGVPSPLLTPLGLLVLMLVLVAVATLVLILAALGTLVLILVLIVVLTLCICFKACRPHSELL